MEIILKEDFKQYFNPIRLLSYYPKIFMFMLVGGRGLGKTTGVLWLALKYYKNKKWRFAYIRRYGDESKGAKNVLSPLITSYQVKGLGVKGCYEWLDGKETMGYCLTLSKQAQLKSIPFKNCNFIIFDEFIMKKTNTRRYITNEPHEFLELISTLVRTRKDYVIFMLSNNADFFNPYFEHFELPLTKGKYIDRERGLFLEYLKTSDELAKEEQETPLYRLTKNTEYGDYHYNNKILTTFKGEIKSKDKDLDLILRMVVNRVTLNIYLNSRLGIYIEYRDKIIKDGYSYVIMEDEHPNYVHVRRLKGLEQFKFITLCYGDNTCVYDSQNAINVFNRTMEMLL